MLESACNSTVMKTNTGVSQILKKEFLKQYSSVH